MLMQGRGRHGKPRIRSARISRTSTPKSRSTSMFHFRSCWDARADNGKQHASRRDPATPCSPARAYHHRPAILLRLLPGRLLRHLPRCHSEQAIHRALYSLTRWHYAHTRGIACSTVATSGRSLVRSANGCSTSIRVRNFSRRWATPLWTFVSATTSKSSEPLLPRNPAATYPSSPTRTYPLKSGVTTSTGMFSSYNCVVSHSHSPTATSTSSAIPDRYPRWHPTAQRRFGSKRLTSQPNSTSQPSFVDQKSSTSKFIRSLLSRRPCSKSSSVRASWPVSTRSTRRWPRRPSTFRRTSLP